MYEVLVYAYNAYWPHPDHLTNTSLVFKTLLGVPKQPPEDVRATCTASGMLQVEWKLNTTEKTIKERALIGCSVYITLNQSSSMVQELPRANLDFSSKPRVGLWRLRQRFYEPTLGLSEDSDVSVVCYTAAGHGPWSKPTSVFLRDLHNGMY